jgi:Zn-finger nucleic acid-binding protein
MRVSGGLLSLRCDYCKSVVYTAADDEGVRYMEELVDVLCPVCAVPLWNASIENVSIRACKKCRGMLIAMGAFEGLIGLVRDENPKAEAPVADDGSDLKRKLQCPVCHRAMETHFYYGGGHVVMEDCERCELNWLDGGELMRIAHMLRPEAAEDWSQRSPTGSA